MAFLMKKIPIAWRTPIVFHLFRLCLAPAASQPRQTRAASAVTVGGVGGLFAGNPVNPGGFQLDGYKLGMTEAGVC
jgi:hypothetical protein